ncbi:hypothetical protein KCU78_g13095, partial [Aureobasidium melanogenum]
MARVTDSRKRYGEVLEGSANKRSKDNHAHTRRNLQSGELLSDVNITADHLSPSFWSTMSSFVQSGATVEAQTRRWRHILMNVYEIGVTQKEENNAVHGQIAQQTLNLLHSAWVAPPYRSKDKTANFPAYTDNGMHASKDDEDGQDEQDHHCDFDFDKDPPIKIPLEAVRLHALGNLHTTDALRRRIAASRIETWPGSTTKLIGVEEKALKLAGSARFLTRLGNSISWHVPLVVQ